MNSLAGATLIVEVNQVKRLGRIKLSRQPFLTFRDNIRFAVRFLVDTEKLTKESPIPVAEQAVPRK